MEYTLDVCTDGCCVAAQREMEPVQEEVDQLGNAVKSRFVEFLKLFSSEADQSKDDYSTGTGHGGDLRRDYLEILMDMKTRDSTTIYVDFSHVQEYAPRPLSRIAILSATHRSRWGFSALRRDFVRGAPGVSACGRRELAQWRGLWMRLRLYRSETLHTCRGRAYRLEKSARAKGR
jgi:hypothetical protein